MTGEKYTETREGWNITVWQSLVIGLWLYIATNGNKYHNDMVKASNRNEAVNKVKEILQEKKG